MGYSDDNVRGKNNPQHLLVGGGAVEVGSQISSSPTWKGHGGLKTFLATTASHLSPLHPLDPKISMVYNLFSLVLIYVGLHLHTARPHALQNDHSVSLPAWDIL